MELHKTTQSVEIPIRPCIVNQPPCRALEGQAVLFKLYNMQAPTLDNYTAVVCVVVPMEAALVIFITFCLTAQLPKLGTFWAFVLISILWTFLEINVIGLGLIAAFVTFTLFSSNYNQSDVNTD